MIEERPLVAPYDGALRKSAEQGHFKIVRYLIQQGANIDVLDDVELKNDI
jgi:hypothetical protein